LERSDRPFVVALCGQEESVVAKDERTESRVAARGTSIDLREQSLGAARVADRKQRLDSGRAGKLGEIPIDLLDIVEKRRGQLPPRGTVVEGELEHPECNSQPEGAPSEVARLGEPKQLGECLACSFGLAPVGLDLDANREAERLERLQPG